MRQWAKSFERRERKNNGERYWKWPLGELCRLSSNWSDSSFIICIAVRRTLSMYGDEETIKTLECRLKRFNSWRLDDEETWVKCTTIRQSAFREPADADRNDQNFDVRKSIICMDYGEMSDNSSQQLALEVLTEQWYRVLLWKHGFHMKLQKATKFDRCEKYEC